MSASNNQLHGVAWAGTFLLVGSLFGATIYTTQTEAAVHEPPLKEYVTIEAQLARKSEKKQQPQKELQAPEPPPPIEGVSHDEHKAPEPKKDPPKPPKPKLPKPPVDLSHRFQHSTDDFQPGAKPTTDIGQFNGSEKGFAPINAGHPYWQNLNADFHRFWELPQISKVKGSVVGCIHLKADGSIVEIRLDAKSGDQILDDSVERALKKVQQDRNDKPLPVPTEELVHIRRGMVCFHFSPNA